MELAIGIVVVGAAILLVIAGVKAWERKKKREAAKEEADRQAIKSARTRAALAVGTVAVGSSAGTLGQSRRYSSAGSVTPQTAQPVVVQQGSGIDPLMAGLIGYGLAGGFSGHSNASHGANNVPAAPLESCKPEEDRSYVPSNSSDDGGNSYSGSSDSGSSYDSGSSDSGGSSGGGGD